MFLPEVKPRKNRLRSFSRLLLPGLMELTETTIPTNLVICERDRVLPHPRFTKHFLKHIPAIDEVTTLDGVGHIPMFEAPERIADLIGSNA